MLLKFVVLILTSPFCQAFCFMIDYLLDEACSLFSEKLAELQCAVIYV